MEKTKKILNMILNIKNREYIILKLITIILCIIVILIIGYFIIKNRNKIRGKYRWLKRKYSRKIFYIRKKYFQQENLIKQTLLVTIGIFFYIVILLFFTNSIGILERTDNSFYPIINFEKLNIESNCYDFLWNQISASLIVTTIVSLLSVFSTTYVYGKKQINVIFNENSLLSLGKMFIYLVILILISLSVCLKAENTHIILISFLITLCIVFYMIFKVILFYTHPFFYKNCVKSDYIRREKKHIKKAMPMDNHIDNEIQNLKEVTMALIQKNDNDYNININAIMDMIEVSLLSNSKNIQEYYTEMIMYRTDFISSIFEIITHLIKYGKITEANHLMAQLYNRLKFYRVVPIQEPFSHSIILDLINAGKYIGNEREALEHYRVLWDTINCSKYFVYLYECELDLSYCRLGKDDIFYFTDNNFLEKVYLSIKENKFLIEVEKERIYEQLYNDIRMMEHTEKFPGTDVRHMWSGEFNKESIEIPLIIKGEPIVLMLLKMFEQQDIKNIALYSTMNLSDKLMDYIVCLTTLALVEFLNKECKRKYVNDLEMTKDQIKSAYINSKFYNRGISTTNLKEIYSIFKEDYTGHTKHRAYSLWPRLTLTLEVIDNYFYVLYKNTDKQEEFYEAIDNKEFKPNENFIKIINELNIPIIKK